MPSTALHQTVRSVLLFGFALYVFRLARLGLLAHYVEPEVAAYVGWSAWGLLAMSLHQARQAWRSLSSSRSGIAACGCEEEPAPFRMKEALIYLLFALPLLVGMMLERA
ncbi:DUF1980 domain-containing protein [Gorillibacterium sp. sgz5001074]|uniref:DUF1980 domain-containing protein n=1 Tax=Gorillibacterium sp. sgz5001074 TaxID=3446695 RepID=UPI003F67F471